MKNPLLKKALPHLVAVLVFLAAAMMFCKPALEGNVLSQDDIIRWKGVAQNSFDYKAQHGHLPLWNPNLFSGMPNYQIAMEGKSILPDTVKIFSLGLPKPINFFFLACICFYILCLSLRIRPLAGMLGSLAFAYSTYNAVIINAGHDTQMLTTAFMPLLLAGLIFTYEKKYWLGLALTTVGAYQEIGGNHLQISFYFLLIAAAITIGYLYTWIKKKEWKHILVAGAITGIGALVGVASHALVLKTTSEYAKYTMRGGKDISIEGDTVKAAKTSGLDTAYAFEYSVGKAETSTLIMPNAFGGGSGNPLSDNSHVLEKLIARGVPEGTAQQVLQIMGSKYWGDLPFTAGPAYLGVILCVLGIIGFVIIKTPIRWALLVATILGIFMSWGKNFAGFNVFLFEHLPLYNKFRAPSMAQVIPQFTVAIIASLTLQKLLFEDKSRELLKADFKKILYAVGGLFALLALMYLMMDYGSPIDARLAERLRGAGADNEIVRAAILGLKEDRKPMFGGQFLRALGLAIIPIGLLYFYMKDKIKPMVVAISLILVSSVELMVTSKHYLNDESYVPADEITTANFTASPVEQQILQDKDPNFRVFNSTVNPLVDPRTPYFFKSITGYHPARLRLYQDILDRYIGQPNEVMNMLNVKYVIIQDPKSGQQSVFPNYSANGACWLVKNVKLVDNQVTEFLALDKTNLKDTALVDKSFSKLVVQPQADSTATIRLTKFDNDQVDYEANSTSPQFAVFSEVYYPLGWNAYLDGKKTDYCKVDYLLRGLSIPAGKHAIKFVFEPESVKQGVKIMYIASFLVLIFFLGGLFMQWRTDKKEGGSVLS